MSAYPPPLGRLPKPPVPAETSEQMHERWLREREADEVAATLGLAFRDPQLGICYWHGNGAEFRAGYEAGKAKPRSMQEQIATRALLSSSGGETAVVVSDSEVAVAFDGTHFGSSDHRRLLHVAVLKKACGYHCGHTITQIMLALGLVGATGLPTKKGRRFLALAYHDFMIGGP